MNENAIRRLGVWAAQVARLFRPSDRGSGQTGRGIVRTLFVAAAYAGSGWLGLQLAVPPGYATAVFPAAGVALAVLLIYGAGLAPGVWLGSFAMNLAIAYHGSGHVTAASAALAATIGVGSTLQALAGAWLIRRAIGWPRALDRERDIGLFLLLGGPFSCLVSSTVGVSSLYLYGAIAPDQFLHNWLNWWVGDVIGVLVTTPLLFALVGRPRAAWRPRRTVLLLPPVALLAASVALFLLASRWEQDQLRAEFHQRADIVADRVQTSLGGYLQALRAIEGLYASSITVERHEFRQFVQSALRDFPGLATLSWNPRVRDAERASFEAAVRREGYVGFQITERDAQGRLRPAARRGEYVVVTFLEPYAGNEAALGYDIASQAMRRAAIELARDSGMAAATGRIRLVQEREEQWGLLLLQPLYRGGKAPDDLESRRRALRGFAVGVLRMDSIVRAVLREDDRRDMSLRFVDESAPLNERTLFDTAAGNPTAAAGALRFEHAFEAAGRGYRIVALPTAAYLAAHPAWVAWAVLAGSLLFCGLLQAFLLLVTGAAARVAQLVEERTGELRDSRERMALAIESSNIALFDWDVATGKVMLSERWSGITGRGPEALATTIAELEALIHPEELEMVRQQTADLIRGRNPFYRVEHRVRTASGNWCWISSRAKVVERDAAGHAVRVTGANVDITERKEVERLKNEFIATVSHELRTPLTAIVGSLGLLKELSAGKLEAEAAAFVDMAQQNSERLAVLINDILDIEKIESGQMEFRLDPVTVRPLLERAVALNAPYAEKLGVSFALSQPIPDAVVSGDEDRLLQVLTNLMSNAAKYSPAGSAVTVSAVARNGSVRVAVADRGPGVPEEFRDRIFEKFAQADGSNTRSKGGTGLGLSIAKAIVERSGGTIGYDSRPGQGTTFYFDLPLRANS